MRHLYGAALAVGMTAVMFFGGAWGYLRLLKLPVLPGHAAALPAGGGSLLSNSTALLAFAALMATAAMAGVLAIVPRISPLASGLPGLALLAWTALYLVSVRQAVHLIPLRSHAFGAGWEGLLFNGVLGAVGAVMIFPMFIPSRWRMSRGAETDAFSSDMDSYLTAVTAVTADPLPRRERDRPREEWKEQREEREERAAEREEQPLVGTVLSRPGGASPVDTTRITGASRALRNTGAFRMATGAQPRATGSMPRAGNPYGGAQDGGNQYRRANEDRPPREP